MWSMIRNGVQWFVLIALLAVTTGSTVALFLFLLDAATHTRWEHPWLLYLLPVGGAVMVLAYEKFGKDAERGTNLIIDRIHEPGGGVPLRMAPFVLFATVATHLFGGSAGREGTAVQMGGATAQWVGGWFTLTASQWGTLLQCGIAAGFGAVFGTPVAGAIFALEVLFVGHFRHRALVPCLLSALAADWVCEAWNVHHTLYALQAGLSVTPILLVKIAVAGCLFGLAGAAFAHFAHAVSRELKKRVTRSWVRPVLGGLAVIVLAKIVGTEDYLGLGVTTADGAGTSIVNAFHEGGATPASWFWKIIFTGLTIGSGFKGGEVTPLFFVGATLGNTLAWIMDAPIDLFAALGFVAVFAGATNTPLACTVMGIELFGGEYALPLALACAIAFRSSGKVSIYASQRGEPMD